MDSAPKTEYAAAERIEVHGIESVSVTERASVEGIEVHEIEPVVGIECASEGIDAFPGFGAVVPETECAFVDVTDAVQIGSVFDGHVSAVPATAYDVFDVAPEV